MASAKPARAIHLTSFYPLCCNAHGRKAIVTYGLKDFIDGSCRREPDFEHPMPAITGLCRPNFVKRLGATDLVVYVTNKKGVGSKKLVAIFEVVKIVKSHNAAASFYKTHSIQTLPNNLMVKSSMPFPLSHTHRMMGWWGQGKRKKQIKTLTEWDQVYQERASSSPSVAICRIWKKHLYLNKKQAVSIPASIQSMGTQNACYLSETQLSELLYGLSV